ncbi:PAS domain-containing sensor histidine kinase [Halorubrum cibi]|uniref:histidine kinase n=1 Tax=Halorubrum cibi TaxID=413815 RepID=A0A521E3X2_9EURY|nr:PAS domain-containing sensor histidine kinase [Halorubrum cibi]SMO78633.1 PAS domain S-box-containing protein [Halorubrum cibi]
MVPSHPPNGSADSDGVTGTDAGEVHGPDPDGIDLRTFREVVRSAGHSIYWTDIGGTIEYVNDAFEEQTGYSAEEAVGSNANILQSGVHDQQFYERLWDTILSGEVWSGEIVNERRDGERYVAKQTISPIVNTDGKIVRFIAVNEDVTELRASRERAERERDRFEQLLDAVPVPLVLTEFSDGDPIVEQTNRAFRERFGFDADRLIGSSLDEFIVDEDDTSTAREINERIRREERVHREVIRRTAGGERRTFLLVATHLTDDGGDEALGAYLDITDRKRAEEEIHRKNRQLEEFAEVVSHDLRNPLNAASGHLEMIDAPEENDPHLESVANAHERMADLIENILSLAKRGRGIDETESIELDAFVSDCWDTIVRGDPRLRNEASGTVRADPTRFRQLLGNLFRNSVEHGSTGSRPTADDSVEHSRSREGVAVPRDDEHSSSEFPNHSASSRIPEESGDGAAHAATSGPPQTADIDHGGGSVTVTVGDLSDGFYVEDDGPGIPEEARADVFESGHTTAEAGTGFGLAIVREIVEAHGWTVAVTDGDAGGARFEFTDVDRE